MESYEQSSKADETTICKFKANSLKKNYLMKSTLIDATLKSTRDMIMVLIFVFWLSI